MHRLALAVLMISVPLVAQDGPAPTRVGGGGQTYDWVPGFATYPDGRELGNTHGQIAVDKAGRIYFNTDTENAVVIFSADGGYLGAWGTEFAGGMHGMCLVDEGGTEFLYCAHIGRHEVLKCTLDGKVVWTLGFPAEAGIYQNANEYRPTDVAVTADGAIYVVDGYGKGWVHQFDAARAYVRSWGGPGAEPGKFKTPHGITLDTRGREPRLVVADRENGRLQIFDLDGGLRSVITGLFRRPCSSYVHPDGRHLVVPDLAGRVTILDERNELVCHLGDQPDPQKRAQNGVGREHWQDGIFLAPHGAAFDRNGDLFVLDWNRHGRVSRLRRVED
jgi:DNA-binding beta-propeller fold protein YncE